MISLKSNLTFHNEYFNGKSTKMTFSKFCTARLNELEKVGTVEIFVLNSKSRSVSLYSSYIITIDYVLNLFLDIIF